MTATYPDKQEFVKAGANLYTQWEAEYGDMITRIRQIGAAQK